MKNQKEQHLENEISSFKSCWKERFDLQEQISTEKSLKEELENAHFSECEYDFGVDFSTFWFENSHFQKGKRDPYFDFDFSKPLLKQVDDLQLKINEIKSKDAPLDDNLHFTEGKSNIDQLKKEIEKMKEEIKCLDLSVNNLLDKIVSFEDDELHELRTQKQHLDLLKKTSNKSCS
ncbi:hypothetical protein M9Y10_014987 [Tritrichomonas musculus]|uniref:Uncharacterized protein n=1 Tax=Tritrichomonas musculus TaxID=1915356 RepID=A0ABR2L124_9EUKA